MFFYFLINVSNLVDVDIVFFFNCRYNYFVPSFLIFLSLKKNDNSFLFFDFEIFFIFDIFVLFLQFDNSLDIKKNLFDLSLNKFLIKFFPNFILLQLGRFSRC